MPHGVVPLFPVSRERGAGIAITFQSGRRSLSLRLVPILFPFAVLCAACEEEGTRDAGQRSATFAEHDVTFKYPAEWAPPAPSGLPEGVTWEVKFGPTERLGYVRVLAYDAGVVPTQEQMAKFARVVFRFVENPALGDKQQGKVVETTIAGVPALEARFVRPSEPGPAAEHRALVFAHGTLAYGLDCFFLSKDVAMISGCDLVIESFSFEDV